MTNVLRIALDRRTELSDEIDRLDGFIRTAHSLMRKLQAPAGAVEAQPDGADTEATEGDAGPACEEQDELAALNDPDTGCAGPTPAEADRVAPGLMRMNLLRRNPTTING